MTNNSRVDKDQVAAKIGRIVARVQAGEEVTLESAAAEFGIQPFEFAVIWKDHVVPAIAEARRKAH